MAARGSDAATLYDTEIAPRVDLGVGFAKIQGLFQDNGEGMSILDLGGGYCTVTSSLSSRHTVVGVDLNKEALQFAQGNGVLPVKCNLERDFPFKSLSFDAVIACDILEHLVNTEGFVRECRRVLKDAGYMIVSVPNYFSLVRRVRFLKGKSIVIDSHEPFRGWNYFHLRFLTLEEFKDLLTVHGFRIEEFTFSFVGETYYEDKSWQKLWRLLNRLPRSLQRFLLRKRPALFAHTFMCRARKGQVP